MAGILDKAINVYAARKSPLEMLKDTRRQSAMDKMEKEQHQAQMQTTQIKMQQQQAELQKQEQEAALLKNIQAGGAVDQREIAKRMEKAAVQLGDPDLAAKWSKVSFYEDKRKEKEVKEKEEQKLAEMRTRIYSNPEDQEAIDYLAGKGEIKHKQPKPVEPEKPLTEAQRLENTRKRQLISEGEIKTAERRRATVKKGVGSALKRDFELDDKGKPTGVNVPSTNMKHVEETVARNFGDEDTSPEKVAAYVNENYVRVEGSKGYLGTSIGAEKTVYIPRQFFDSVGDPDEAAELWKQLMDDMDTKGSPSEDTRKKMAKYGMGV